MTKPEVTILLPWGGEHKDWLEQAISSFPKGTPYLVLENKGEMTQALNEGLKAATTPFVIAFGADDIALPGFLDQLLVPSWNADVVYPAMILMSEDLEKLLGLHDADAFCANRLHDNNFVSGAALVRREKVLEVGGWRDRPYEDWDLWIRMHKAGARFKPCPEAAFLYRQHEHSRLKTLKRDEFKREVSPSPEGILATFYNQATPATTYVRCQLPARELPGIVRSSVHSKPIDDEPMEFPEHQGAAIFQFAADKSRALTALNMKQVGIRVLIETDDNYLVNPGKEILERQGWGMTIGESTHTRDGHRYIVRNADGVIVTTPFLAEQYRELNPNVFVCPNGVDPSDWPEPVKPDDGILRIAWFASRSHSPDIDLITPAFEWASRQPKVEVYVVGLHPLWHSKHGPIRRWRFTYGYLPWIHDLDQYRHAFQQFDVGVAPVKASPSGLGRSDLKALEMSMGLQAPILSDVSPYDSWVDGENCLKAKDSQGFLKAIQHLVANRDEVPQLARAARDYVLTHRTAEAQIDCWRDAL